MTESKTFDKYLRLLFIGAALVCIKSVFADFGHDQTYTIAMSYRHIAGDRMLDTMWEPHQTSIFVTDILMTLYKLIVPSYTGVSVFLQICSILLYFAVCLPIYKILCSCAGQKTAALAYIFLILFRCKQVVLLDYANLQIAFSILLFACLVRFLLTNRKGYLVMAALCLAFETLSYPSAAITYVAVVLILALKSEERKKSILLFTGSLAITAALYSAYFILTNGFENVCENVRHIFLSDSHNETPLIVSSYYVGMLQMLIWIAGAAALSFLIVAVVVKLRSHYIAVYGTVLAISEAVMLFASERFRIDWTCSFYIIPLLLAVLGLVKYREMSQDEQTVWVTGVLISVSSFFATMLLTDLSLCTVLAYLVLAGAVSFVPISHFGRDGIQFLVTVVALVIVHRGIVSMGFINGNIYRAENIIRNGPNAGIVTDYMTYWQAHTNERDFKEYVSPDDSLLVVEHWLLDGTLFMYSGSKVANSSVIDTPIYNSELFEYYQRYPEKVPDVVAVDCWFGNLNVSEDSVIMQWVNDNYTVSGDGDYWKFYKKKN